jgi:hypothetical protein
MSRRTNSGQAIPFTLAGRLDGDRLTRWTAVAAVLAVAAVAALISYRHAVLVVISHGEPGMVGRLYPVVIDGLIVAASMVLLDSARHGETPPVLAWAMLAAGIGATLAVNVLAGLPAGWLSAIVASWPAAAFVGCCELVMMLVRSAARRTAKQAGDAPDTTAPNAILVSVPANAESAALTAMRATYTAGNPLSGRQLETRFGLTRAQATRVRQAVLTEANTQEADDVAAAA